MLSDSTSFFKGVTTGIKDSVKEHLVDTLEGISLGPIPIGRIISNALPDRKKDRKAVAMSQIETLRKKKEGVSESVRETSESAAEVVTHNIPTPEGETLLTEQSFLKVTDNILKLMNKWQDQASDNHAETVNAAEEPSHVEADRKEKEKEDAERHRDLLEVLKGKTGATAGLASILGKKDKDAGGDGSGSGLVGLLLGQMAAKSKAGKWIIGKSLGLLSKTPLIGKALGGLATATLLTGGMMDAPTATTVPNTPTTPTVEKATKTATNKTSRVSKRKPKGRKAAIARRAAARVAGPASAGAVAKVGAGAAAKGAVAKVGAGAGAKVLPGLLGRLAAAPLIPIMTTASGFLGAFEEYKESGDAAEAAEAYLAGVTNFITLGLIGEEELRTLISDTFDVIRGTLVDMMEYVADLFSWKNIRAAFEGIPVLGDLIKDDAAGTAGENGASKASRTGDVDFNMVGDDAITPQGQDAIINNYSAKQVQDLLDEDDWSDTDRQFLEKALEVKKKKESAQVVAPTPAEAPTMEDGVQQAQLTALAPEAIIMPEKSTDAQLESTVAQDKQKKAQEAADKRVKEQQAIAKSQQTTMVDARQSNSNSSTSITVGEGVYNNDPSYSRHENRNFVA
jgi:hypothetical protein